MVVSWHSSWGKCQSTISCLCTTLLSSFLLYKFLLVFCLQEFGGKTPLMVSSKSNNVSAMKILVEHGADLDIVDVCFFFGFFLPLLYFLYMQNRTAMQLLCSRHATVVISNQLNFCWSMVLTSIFVTKREIPQKRLPKY